MICRVNARVLSVSFDSGTTCVASAVAVTVYVLTAVFAGIASGADTLAEAPGASAGVATLARMFELPDRTNVAVDAAAGAVPMFATVTAAVVVLPAYIVGGVSDPCMMTRFAPGTTAMAIVDESLFCGSKTTGWFCV